jgi:hypothetical protein
MAPVRALGRHVKPDGGLTRQTDGRMSQAEGDRSAQLIFERARGRHKRKRKAPKSAASAKKRRVVGDGAGARMGHPPRRSPRCRKRRADPAFHWNFKDTYVLALDEVTAPTMIHCYIADRMKRRKLAHMLKLV